MSLPKPPVELKDHCSILHKDTLYVYTPEAFLSIALEEGAEWKEHDQGVSVNGAQCTKGNVGGDKDHHALYVVGGKSDDPEYKGLQRFSLSEGKWESIQPFTNDVRNRVKHAAIFLDSTSEILVFAGTTNDDPNPSTQTFLISVSPPYGVEGFNDQVPPATAPLLLPWDEGTAAMVGGGPTNQKVYTFGADTGWKESGAALETPLADRSTVQCATVNGDDGSKILQVFDMGASPNTVKQYVLIRPDGSPAGAGETIGGPQTQQIKKHKKRQLSLADYPPYDDSNASRTSRSGFSLAQDTNGKVVISGGGDGGDPISVYDQSENAWVDTEQLFLGTSTSSSATSSSTSTSASTSSSSSASSSAFATNLSVPTGTESALPPSSPPADDKSNTMTIVGATLGAILGLAAILIIILLYLAYRKRKQKYPPGQGEGNLNDKDRLSFQDQGMEPLTGAAKPMGRGPVPSTDSWAFVSGQGQADGPRKPPPATFKEFNFGTDKAGGSPLRNVETTTQDKGMAATTASRDPRGTARGDRLTDEGWGKYFQGNGGHHDGDNRSTMSSDETKSDFGNDVWPHPSAEVPPLTLKPLDEPQPLQRVVSGSPNTERAPNFEGLAAQRGMTAKISNTDSASISSIDSQEENNKDAFSSGVPASVGGDSDWTSVRGPFSDERVASSNYSSMYFPGPPGNNTNSSSNNQLGTAGATTALSGGSSERRITQWPSQMQPTSQNPDKPKKGRNLSSDNSWLHLGGNK